VVGGGGGALWPQPANSNPNNPKSAIRKGRLKCAPVRIMPARADDWISRKCGRYLRYGGFSSSTPLY
jgi:hypothetical protein